MASHFSSPANCSPAGQRRSNISPESSSPRKSFQSQAPASPIILYPASDSDSSSNSNSGDAVTKFSCTSPVPSRAPPPPPVSFPVHSPPPSSPPFPSQNNQDLPVPQKLKEDLLPDQKLKDSLPDQNLEDLPHQKLDYSLRNQNLQGWLPHEKLEDLPPRFDEEPFSFSASRPCIKQRSVHEFLGGGKLADELLWKRKGEAMSVLLGSTIAWMLMEFTQFNVLSAASYAVMIIITALFIGSNLEAVLTRSSTTIAKITISEASVAKACTSLACDVNKMMSHVRQVILGRDFGVFCKMCIGLWFLANVGSVISFWTLVYIAILLAYSLPAFYDKYGDQIDRSMAFLFDEIKRQYGILFT